MAQSLEEELLQAIKKDDAKAFRALMEKTQYVSYRLGRFPVLSLLYLYRARKILSAYETIFIKVTNFKPLREPAEVSGKFSQRAGKCLRLYLNEEVSPLEMLLILDRTKRLKRVYPLAQPSEEVKERLRAIYSIKYALGIKFEGDQIIPDKRPLTSREKKRIAVACMSSALAAVLAVGIPVTAVALIPKPVEGEVTRLSQIDFASEKEYTLKRDITVPKNYSVEQTNCVIVGEGHKLTFGAGASFGTLNGKISDLTIESTGNEIFTSVSPNASIENVTVNVNASVSAAAGTAFLAGTNYGTIDGVTLNASGKVSALATSTEATAELSFGGLVQNNDYIYNFATQTVYGGTVKNCTVNYSGFELAGMAAANAAFGGVAGINGGYLQDCTVTGEIVADTFDVAGVCAVNSGLLSGNVNEADLSQTSADTGWNPIVCGIVLSNSYVVENCVNKGNISSVSTCGQFDYEEGTEPAASASGIAYLSRGTSSTIYLISCVNLGSVTCVAEHRDVYAAGVCISSSGGIEKCTNGGAVKVTAYNGCGVYVGGITALAYGYIYLSVNEGDISATGSGATYAGGISAHSRSQFSYCFSSGEITAAGQNVCAGGIFGFSEVLWYGALYCGTADHCISENTLIVTVTDDAPAYIGGIAGCMREAELKNGDSVSYVGGSIADCYFTGECITEVQYFGNIAGICGANIHANNSFTLGGTEYRVFGDNYYAGNSHRAFGAALTADGEFIPAEDKGAASAAIETIRTSEMYRQILTALKKSAE